MRGSRIFSTWGIVVFREMTVLASIDDNYKCIRTVIAHGKTGGEAKDLCWKKMYSKLNTEFPGRTRAIRVFTFSTPEQPQ